MMRYLRPILCALTLLLSALAAAPARAGEVDKSFRFEMDHWYDLEVTDGPVTLHRIRVKEDTGVTKSKIFRMGSKSDYSTTVVIELEYSNESSKDWEAHIEAYWVDGQGREIDGYKGTEGLGEDKKEDDTTMTFATLRYGLERAEKLIVKIEFEKD